MLMAGIFKPAPSKLAAQAAVTQRGQIAACLRGDGEGLGAISPAYGDIWKELKVGEGQMKAEWDRQRQGRAT